MQKRQNSYRSLKGVSDASKTLLNLIKMRKSCFFLPLSHISVVCDKLSRQGDCQGFSIFAYDAAHVALLESTLSWWCMLAFIANLSFEILQGSRHIISFLKTFYVFLLQETDSLSCLLSQRSGLTHILGNVNVCLLNQMSFCLPC